MHPYSSMVVTLPLHLRERLFESRPHLRPTY
jgi:hypothetical protein